MTNKLVIPSIPKSINKFAGRQNAWEYRNEKDTWNELVYYSCKEQKIKPINGKALVSITYYFPTKHRRDPDNYSGKFILDGLVKAKVLKDDSFNHIDLRISGSFDKNNPRTEIIIKEV